MCGITGTIFTKKLNHISRVDPYSIYKDLMDSGDVLTKQEIGKLYKFSIAYKSDINFIKYFESSDERETVDRIVKILKKKTKSLLKTDLENSKLYSIDSWINDRDKILDVIWFLDYELLQLLPVIRMVRWRQQ